MSTRGRAAGRTLSAPALAVVLLLTGCSSGAPGRPPSTSGGMPSASGPVSLPAGALTPEDDGAEVALPVGGTARLRVPGGTSGEPSVTGTAVELVELRNAAATGQREWEVRAVTPGTGLVHGAEPERWTLTFRVGG